MKSNSHKVSEVSTLTRDVEEAVENKIMLMLEKKVGELTKDLEVEKAAKIQVDIELKKMKFDFQELTEFKLLAESHVQRERELKRVFEKEVAKLKEERRSQENYIENLKLKLSELDSNYNNSQ
jgi:hypothetical protein